MNKDNPSWHCICFSPVQNPGRAYLLTPRPDPLQECVYVPSFGQCKKTRRSRCGGVRSEEHTSELQSRGHLVCRLLLEKKKRRRRPNGVDGRERNGADA